MHRCSVRFSKQITHAFLLLTAAIGLLCLMTACGPSGKSYRINGSITGMKTGELYIYQPAEDHARFDTIQVKDGKFRYSGETGGTAPVFLLFPNALEQVIFVGRGQTLEYQAEANKLQAYTVEGNDENKRLNELRKQILGLNRQQTADKCELFIRKNSQTAAAVYVFQRYFVQDESTPTKRLKELLRLLRKQQPDDRRLLAAEGYLRQLQAGQTGTPTPNVKLHPAGGHKADIRHPKKDFMLLCFWATWMQNVWDFNTTLQDVQQRYGDRLETVCISLDTQVYKWQEYVGADTIGHIHCCDGMAWDNEAVKALGIRHLPSFIIVDKKGIIRKRGTDTGTLQRTLSDLLP